SITYLRKAPKSDAAVMVVTMGIVVATHDLSKGVIAGVILSAIFFVVKISKIKVEMKLTDAGILYSVQGQLFFASVEDFLAGIDLTDQNQDIRIDFTDSHVWDDSAVGAIDKAVLKLRENGNEVTVQGLNASSRRIIDRQAVYTNDTAIAATTE